MAHQRLGHRVQHQFQLGFGLLDPVRQQYRWVNHRDPRTTTLLTCADRHLTPVLQAFVSALVFEANFTAIAEDRRDFIDAQFGGFLDRPVHPLAAGQALAEMDLQR